MTEQNHHDPAELDKLAEKFTVLPNDNPASDAKRAELIDKPAFGQVFSDNMAHMTWTKGEGWSDRRIEPYAPLKMDPGASVLHYAQECFEGLKAYRHADGSTWLFRPDANAERFQNSAKRLYLPELPIDDFIGSVAALVKRDVNWVPTRREYTLYMRPFMFASEPFLGVRAPQEVDYCVIASPSGPYFPGGVKPVSIWLKTSGSAPALAAPASPSAVATTPHPCWANTPASTTAASRSASSTPLPRPTSRSLAA